jgi:hypothetical protein
MTDTSIHLPAGLTPRGDDQREDPAHCVIANAIRETIPWAKSVKVGKQKITVYDYRCEHNPEGKLGGCDECVGRGYAYDTPEEVADCLTEFDESGDCVFPAIDLGNPKVKVSAQDRQQKRAAMVDYRERIAAGSHKPNPRSNQSIRAADRRRRAT